MDIPYYTIVRVPDLRGLNPRKMKRRKAIKSKYGFDKIAVGYGFRYPPKDRPKVAPAASRYGKRTGKKLPCKKGWCRRDQ